jgi:transposase
LFPGRTRKRDGQWRDDRTILNGIFWRLHTGAPWRDLPQRYGSWQTVYPELFGKASLPADAGLNH